MFIMIQAVEGACFENPLPCQSHLQGLIFGLCVKLGFAKNVQCHLQGRNEGGGKGGTIPRAPIPYGGTGSLQGRRITAGGAEKS